MRKFTMATIVAMLCAGTSSAAQAREHLTVAQAKDIRCLALAENAAIVAKARQRGLSREDFRKLTLDALGGKKPLEVVEQVADLWQTLCM